MMMAMVVVCVCHYPLWCVAVLDSYDDGDDGSVCVCHYPLWCVVVLDSYDDGDDGCVCVSLSSLVCCSVGQL